MEALIFALIAVQNTYTRSEPVVAETQTFQPFDLQSLRYAYEATERSTIRSTDRNNSHLAEVVS
jgi:hypothetical protein